MAALYAHYGALWVQYQYCLILSRQQGLENSSVNDIPVGLGAPLRKTFLNLYAVLSEGASSHPSGCSAVVIDEKGSSIGGYPHLPAWGQEALLCFVLRFGGAVRGRLRRLWVGECVLYSPPHLDVVGSLERKRKPYFSNFI